jgi:SAM-dependent methyltransferase
MSKAEAKPTLGPDHFEALYAADPDPWKFATSEYEHRKYELTLAGLPRARYTTGLEVGCSIGVLTEKLGARCEVVIGVDLVASALDQARHRCAAFPNVRFEQMAVPRRWPDGQFDLIVLSEILYFFDAGDLSLLAERVGRSAVSGGDIALVHWTGPTDDPLPGDRAVELFIEQMDDFASILRAERHETFRLDILRRR